MILWVVMAVLAVAASLSVLVPLYRGRRPAVGEGRAALAIYKDQLGEVESDFVGGLIGADEASAARTEIARRAIKADAAPDDVPATAPASERPRRVAAVVTVLAVPVLAIGLYLLVGSPQLPDRPLAARLSGALEAADLPALVARVEAHLATSPNDGQGWGLIAPVYLKAGRYDDAVRAFSNAVRLLGPSAEREADLGDAIMRANRGVVSEDARAAFRLASQIDPAAVKPRFFLAIALTQQGARDEAIAAWHALLQGAPADAPWLPVARQALASLAAAPPAPGPTAADLDAASKLTTEQRQAMISGMVDQLAAKLQADPADAEGWARLIQSYMVLGRKDDATAALARARTALAGKADRLAVVEAGARASGLIE
jgi:cytochrome c-type biogenesis protein CcmH